jgi:hypothetical protein
MPCPSPHPPACLLSALPAGPPGSQCPYPGTGRPQLCPPGSFAMFSNTVQCQLCPKNYFSKAYGQKACHAWCAAAAACCCRCCCGPGSSSSSCSFVCSSRAARRLGAVGGWQACSRDVAGLSGPPDEFSFLSCSCRSPAGHSTNGATGAVVCVRRDRRLLTLMAALSRPLDGLQCGLCRKLLSGLH